MKHSPRCNAFQSACENVRDAITAGDVHPSFATLEYLDREAEGYVRDGLSTCTCPEQHQHTHEFQRQRLTHSHPHDEPHGYFEHPEDVGAPRETYSVEVYFELRATDDEEAFKAVHEFLRRRETEIRYAGMHYELLEGAAALVTEYGREEI